MDYAVVITQDETGAFIADVPALRGCHSWGKTHDEAIAHVKEAIQLCLEDDSPAAEGFVGVETVQIDM